MNKKLDSFTVLDIYDLFIEEISNIREAEDGSSYVGPHEVLVRESVLEPWINLSKDNSNATITYKIEIVKEEIIGDREKDRVFKITDRRNSDTLYFKIKGYYNSWEGTRWDDFKNGSIVTPGTIEETVYTEV